MRIEKHEGANGLWSDISVHQRLCHVEQTNATLDIRRCYVATSQSSVQSSNDRQQPLLPVHVYGKALRGATGEAKTSLHLNFTAMRKYLDWS